MLMLARNVGDSAIKAVSMPRCEAVLNYWSELTFVVSSIKTGQVIIFFM